MARTLSPYAPLIFTNCLRLTMSFFNIRNIQRANPTRWYQGWHNPNTNGGCWQKAMSCASGQELNVTYNYCKGNLLNTNLPSVPGSYAIGMFNPYLRKLTIGALDRQAFPAGCYIYVGSARGSGGLHARVGRHLDHTAMKPTHWHIDALTSEFEITEVWWAASKENVECRWAGWLSEALSRHVANFGASDCRCPGHLFFTADQGGITSALSCLRQNFKTHVHQFKVDVQTQARSENHGTAD